MSRNIRLSKKHGLNPTIPQCWYCGGAHNMICLTGERGEAAARKLGREDGEMPKTALFSDILEPCEECRKKGGIGVVEVGKDGKSPTGNRWLVTEEAIERLHPDEEAVAAIKEDGVMLISTTLSKEVGFYDPQEDD